MYIYKFSGVEIEWSDGDTTYDEIDVVAKSYSQAIQKLERYVLSPKHTYTDDDGNKVFRKSIDFQGMERGDYVDC